MGKIGFKKIKKQFFFFFYYDFHAVYSFNHVFHGNYVSDASNRTIYTLDRGLSRLAHKALGDYGPLGVKVSNDDFLQ